MTAITSRYHSAVHAKSLRPDARKGDIGVSYTDIDVLGAMGLADKRLTKGYVITGPGKGHNIEPAPLAVALERLFAGDGRAAHAIVQILADIAYQRSWVIRLKIGREACHDLACKCLAWHRRMGTTCMACGGLGKDRVKDQQGRDTNTTSLHECQPCRGMGTIQFDTNFRHEHKELARWLVNEMEVSAGMAAPAAMRALSSRMEL